MVMLCASIAFDDNSLTWRKLLQRAVVCPNGYDAVNGIAESKLRVVTTHALPQQTAIVVLAALPRNSGDRPIIRENANVEDHEARRKVIRQWMSLPKNRRHTAEQAVEFAKKAVEQNELRPSRRDPHQRVLGWLLPRIGR